MGKLIGVTFPIIKGRVGGEGGAKNGNDVKRINQLLRMAGYLKGSEDDKVWGKKSEKALEEFYNRHKNMTRVSATYIDPKDPFDFLCTLAHEAGVLIPLPANLRSASALRLFFETCVARRFKYGWTRNGKALNGGTRTIWGFEGRKGWAISTVNDGTGKYFFASEFPATLNCTSFANLMMSVWLTGNAHEKPYDASQMVGGFDPLGWRYYMQAINDNKLIFEGYCFDVDAVVNCVQPNRLYYLGMCEKDDGIITHDTVVLNGEVYECNLTQEPAVYKTKIAERIKPVLRKGCVRILGPSPF